MSKLTIVRGVSAAMVRDATVLLVRRGTEPAVGRWAFPGGRMEPGETAEAAVRRELLEETGLQAGAVSLLTRVDIAAGEDRLFRLSVFRAEYIGGEAVAGDDAAEVRWIHLQAWKSLELADAMGDALAMLGS